MHATINSKIQRRIRSRLATLKFSVSVIALLITFGTLSESYAIIIPAGSNTTDPGTGVQWDNVVQVNGSGGVYLGGGWVITAAHVGFDPSVTIDGTAYSSTDPSCRFALSNDGWDTDNLTTLPPDLFLFRLDSAPSPDMSLTYGGLTTASSSNITMIGYGGGKSWGNNDVEALTNPNPPPLTTPHVIGTTPLGNPPVDTWETLSVITDYDTGTANEGQAITNDSGGGAFYQDGSGNWVLGGIIFAIGSNANDTVDFTFIADLDAYDIGPNGISGIMASHGSVPEPTSCLLALFGSLALLLSRRKRRIGR